MAGVSYCSYLPLMGCEPLTQSGQSFFTIGAGIDLHRWGKAALESLMVSSATLTKLQPILGLFNQEPDAEKRFQAAQAQCAAKGWSSCFVRLTPEEADDLGARVMDAGAQRLQAAYNSDVRNGLGVKFESLRLGIRTAVYSVAHQFGDIWGDSARLPDEVRLFWRQAVTQSWSAAIETLNGMAPDYGKRHNLEAWAIQRAYDRLCSSAQACACAAGGAGRRAAAAVAACEAGGGQQSESDVAFLADASGSIGEADFDKLRKVLTSLVADWIIGPASLRVALMVFSSSTQMVPPVPTPPAPPRSPRLERIPASDVGRLLLC
jgi:hypothetical protein